MAGGTVCVAMGDLFRGAQRPVDLVFTAPLLPSGACGDRFSVSEARITIAIADQLVWDVTVGLPFRFEP